MGFIVENYGDRRYRTLDGNAGNKKHPLYNNTLWTGSTAGNLKGGLGGGIVCFNERHDDGGMDVKITGFLKLPPMFFLNPGF